MTEQQPDRVDINWVQVSASALAAVSSAVLLSTVGVAGTIIGAAIGSVFATAGSSIYSHYLRVSRARVAAAQAAALERVTRARSEASGAWAQSRREGRTTTIQTQARENLEEAEEALEETAARPSWREVLAGLPWKRIAVAAGGVFAVAMLLIVSFELFTGRAVSTYTGGTDSGARSTIPGLGKEHSSTPGRSPAPTSKPSTASSDQPSSGTSPTPTPSATPSSGASSSPSSSPSPSSTPSSVPPTPAPSSAPTIVETPTPVQTPNG